MASEVSLSIPLWMPCTAPMNRQVSPWLRPRVKARDATRRSAWNRFNTNSPSRLNQIGRSSTRQQPGEWLDRSHNFRFSSRPSNSNAGNCPATCSKCEATTSRRCGASQHWLM
ncbi:hypothetical protein D3C78_1276170 [compost metagenome]